MTAEAIAALVDDWREARDWAAFWCSSSIDRHPSEVINRAIEKYENDWLKKETALRAKLENLTTNAAD